MTTTGPESCDLILRGAQVLTMDAQRTLYPAGAIAVRGHTIAAVGPEPDVVRRWRAPRVLDADGGIVYPGFIDAHLHINAQTCRGFFRGDTSKGGGTGPNYADWKAALRPEDEQAAAALGCLELLRHGYTAFVEPGTAFEPDAIAVAAEATGVRCSLADPYLWDDVSLMDVIGGLKSESLFARVPPSGERALKLLGGQLYRNRDKEGIVHGHVALYGEGTASDALMRAAKTLADREEVVLNAHLGFDIDLAEAMEARWGRPRFAYLAELGVLGPNTTFVHMNVIRDGDVEPILTSGLSIVWCPLAYLSRGTPRRLPTRSPEMRRRGAPVALGTDSARQSTVGDAPFLAVHLAAEAGQPIISEDAIEMVTLGGARAAGLDRLIGSLEPGKRADIVVRRSDAVELAPGIDPAHQLVTVGHGPTADTVLVNGRVVMRGGRSTLVSEEAVVAEARASVGRMAERLGLGLPGRWPRGV
ncbi:MAG: amidohydrolase family protein [Candidatus Rokuibacteriota bacterium]